MAGVKGRSGGARPNSGPKPRKVETAKHDDPLRFLLDVMNDNEAAAELRLKAAAAAMPYIHPKKGEGGKKDQAAEKAKQAATGRFKPRPAPLKLVSGG